MTMLAMCKIGCNSPMRMNYNQQKQNVNSKKEKLNIGGAMHPALRSEKEKWGFSEFAVAASLLALSSAIALNQIDKEKRQDTVDSFVKEMTDVNARENIILEDVTGDQHTDIVLLKEDGSRKIYDLHNGQIVENKDDISE